MSRKPRNTKAEILADIERIRLEKAAARREAMRLTATGAEAKVVEERDKDTGKLRVFVRAHRLDCFAMLLKGDDCEGERQAVDWLESLIREASGENGHERSPDFIRASNDGAPGQNVSQRMIEASRTLEMVEANLRPWEARLLFELLKPDSALLTRWRDVVKRVTGAATPQRQGERLVVACESLLWVRQNEQALLRRRAAAKAA